MEEWTQTVGNKEEHDTYIAESDRSYVRHSPGPGPRAEHLGPVNNQILFLGKNIMFSF